MSRGIAFLAALMLVLGCSARRPAPTPDLAPNPQLAVFHTAVGVYAVPVAVGATSWRAQGARIEPDADDDGIPASLDESENGACAASSPFHLEMRGEEIAIAGGRVVAKAGNIATVMSPFGNIQILTEVASVRPGAHVNVVGVRDARSPLDTVKAKSVVVLCDAPEGTAHAVLPAGARLVEEAAGNPSRPPLFAPSTVAELAHR